jgi:ABC-type glutathione transport system ATPase component
MSAEPDVSRVKTGDGKPSAIPAGRSDIGFSLEPILRLQSVSKRFGTTLAVDDLSLDILPGEFFALLGPSGCGKSTVLRMIAGFEQPDSGGVMLDGEDVSAVPPHRRPVNMMFQSYALFPHMSVEKNIAFGLQQEGLSRDAIRGRVEEAMRLVRLEGLNRRKPHQLSGGQSSALRWRARLSNDPSCCCWTSRLPRSTRSCGRKRSSNSLNCRNGWAQPSSSSPTIRKKR